MRSCQGRAADQWPRDGWAIGKEPAAETLEILCWRLACGGRCPTRVEQRLGPGMGQQAGWAWCSSMRCTMPPCTRRV